MLISGTNYNVLAFVFSSLIVIIPSILLRIVVANVMLVIFLLIVMRLLDK